MYSFPVTNNLLVTSSSFFLSFFLFLSLFFFLFLSSIDQKVVVSGNFGTNFFFDSNESENWREWERKKNKWMREKRKSGREKELLRESPGMSWTFANKLPFLFFFLSSFLSHFLSLFFLSLVLLRRKRKKKKEEERRKRKKEGTGKEIQLLILERVNPVMEWLFHFFSLLSLSLSLSSIFLFLPLLRERKESEKERENEQFFFPIQYSVRFFSIQFFLVQKCLEFHSFQLLSFFFFSLLFFLFLFLSLSSTQKRNREEERRRTWSYFLDLFLRLAKKSIGDLFPPKNPSFFPRISKNWFFPKNSNRNLIFPDQNVPEIIPEMQSKSNLSGFLNRNVFLPSFKSEIHINRFLPIFSTRIPWTTWICRSW